MTISYIFSNFVNVEVRNVNVEGETILNILIVNYVNYCIFCSLLLNVHHLYIILSILRCFRHPNFLRFAKCWLFCEVGQINMYLYPSFLCIRPSEYRKMSCLKTILYTVFFYIKKTAILLFCNNFSVLNCNIFFILV